MAAASIDRDGLRKDADLVAFPMAASTKVYNDTLVFNLGGTGFVGPARTGNANDLFAGVAQGGVDNSNGVAGAKKARLKRNGSFAFAIAVAPTPALNGQPAYAADDSTVTATATGAIKVGTFIYDEQLAPAGLVRVDVSKGVA